MVKENEVIAVFKADIEQYKAQVGELGAVNKQVEKSTDSVIASTQKYEKTSKSAATSVSVLSRGLGGVAGLLGITGRLFGVNTDRLQELIFTSQQFGRIAKQLTDVQKASNVATKQGIALKEADVVASQAQAAANRAALGPIGLLIGAAVAIGVAIWNVIGAKKIDAQSSDDQTEAIYRHIKALALESDAEKASREERQKDLDENGFTLKRGKEAKEAVTKVLNEEAAALKEVADAQEELNKTRKGGVADLERELELLKVKTGQTETEKIRNARAVFTKEQEIRTEELKLLEERQKTMGEFALFDTELTQNIANKKNQIIVSQADFENKQANRKFEKLKQDGEDTRNAINQELQFRIASLQGINEEEKKIAIQSIKTRIELGVATREEIDALAKYEIEQMKKVTDAQIAAFKERQEVQDKFTAFRIASLTGHDKDEQRIALQAIKTRKALGTATEAELDALDRFEKEINDKRVDAAKEVADAIFKAQEEGFNRRKELLQKEVDLQQTNINTQRRLAEAGLENTLAFEQKRAADLQRQQQEEAKKQKRIKLLETFLNSLAEFSKTDPKTAISKALLQVALAQAASAVFAEEGGIIGEIGARSNLSRRHKGGGDVLLHAQTGEGILSRREMDNLGKRNFHLLKDAARFPVRDDVFAMPKLVAAGGISVSNADVVKELKALQHIVKNKRETHWEVNKFGEYVTTSIENGVTEITKGKLKKPRFRA